MSTFITDPYGLCGIGQFTELAGQAVYWLIIAAAGHIGYRWVRAYERNRVGGARTRRLQRRVRRLEASLARVESQLEHSLEAQRFTSALLLGRAGEDSPRLSKHA